MPLVIKDVKWEQTQSTVTLYLPLNGVAKKAVDLFCTPKYVKVSYPPNFYEAYLFDQIDEAKSKAEIRDDLIVLALQKVVAEQWNGLEHASANDRQIMRQIRAEALEFCLAKSAAEATDKKQKKLKHQGFVVSEHMDRESRSKREVDSILSQEKLALLGSLEFEKEADCEPTEELVIGDNDFEDLLQKMAAVESKHACKVPKPKPARTVTSIRQPATISCTTTPRVFPTPQRESQVEIEKEWFEKQVSYRKYLSGNGEACAPEEKDPLWLKRKGDSLYDTGDWTSAMSCYSHAVSLGCCMPEIYLNRGLCHMNTGNLHKSLEDMDKALEHCRPAVAANEELRKKAYWARGAAFCALGLFDEGRIELSEALRLDPDNEKISGLLSCAKDSDDCTALREKDCSLVIKSIPRC